VLDSDRQFHAGRQSPIGIAQMQAMQGLHALSTMIGENAIYPAGPCFPPIA
jgi:hypothetical protein